MSKRILSLVLAFAMILGTFSFVAAETLTDIAGHWAEERIQYLYDEGIVSGHGGSGAGTFAPGAKITRAEFATMVNKAFEFTVAGGVEFDDVAESAWYYEQVAIAVEAGFIVGDGDGTFRPNDAITRQEAAIMVSQAYGLEQVEEPTTEFRDADQISGWAVGFVNAVKEIGFIVGDPDGSYRPLESITRAEAASILYGVVTYEPADELEVVSVDAANAEEILVTFSKDIDRVTGENLANYEVKVNGNEVDLVDVKVDGKTALIRGDGAFTVGDKFVVQVKDAVTSTDGIAVDRFASEQINYTLSVAPELEEVNVLGDQLVFTFDRPVDVTSPTLIKVDDLSVTAPLVAVDDEEAGNYRYTLAVSEAALEEGTHAVVLFDVAETARENAAVASILNGSYTISDDEVAPVVVDVIAINSNRFFIELNRAATAITPELTVVKGNHEFTTQEVSIDASTALDPELSSTVYAQAGTYALKPGYFVVITDADKEDENPLYRGNETSATLDITFENFQVVDSSLLGERYQGRVTLEKDTDTPTVKESKIVGNNILVEFEDVLTDALEAKDIVVRNKDNVVIAPQSISLIEANEVVQITLTEEQIKDEPYTVEFKANTLTYAEVLNDVRFYVLESNKNDRIITTAESEDATNFKYVAFNGSVELAQDEPNQITVNYGRNMGSSATLVSNYRLDGQSLPAGTTADFVGNTQTVVITLPEGTIKASTEYKFTIVSAVQTAADEYVVANVQTKAPYETVLELEDNIQPELQSAKFIDIDEDTNLTNQIELTFSEAMQVTTDGDATDDVLVKVVGNTIDVASVEVDSEDNQKIIITLGTEVNTTQSATVELVPESDDYNPVVNLLDLAGNKVAVGPAITVTK